VEEVYVVCVEEVKKGRAFEIIVNRKGFRAN